MRASCLTISMSVTLLLFLSTLNTTIQNGKTIYAAASTPDSGSAGIEDADDPWAEADPVRKDNSFPQEPIAGKELQEVPQQNRTPRPGFQQLVQQFDLRKYKVELAFIAFCLAYIVNIILGRRKNAQLARAWAKSFCREGGVFEKNFALVGAGQSKAKLPLIKESGSEFKLYCSGRRHCKSLMATLNLKKRQDLFTLLVGLLFPWDDKLDIEVVMNEASMPQIVLAIATKKLIKPMLKEEGGEDDVRKLTRKMEVSRERLASWPSDKLVIYAEHSSIFFDLMPEQIAEQIFSRSAFEAHGKYFRFMHFTSEQSYGPKDQRAVLRFSFLVPPKERIEDMGRLLASVFTFIDIVGNYRLAPDMKKRAEKLRYDVEKRDAKDKEKERQEALEERRMAKRAEEQEKVRRMTPEQREKYEQRKSKIETNRQQRKYVRKG